MDRWRWATNRNSLERAAASIAASRDDRENAVPDHIRLVQADLMDPHFPDHGFATVLGLGLTHLFDDLDRLLSALRQQVANGGELYLSGLVAGTRRGRAYLALLHRAGEIAAPKTPEEPHAALGRPAAYHTIGCMAYATIQADSIPEDVNDGV